MFDVRCSFYMGLMLALFFTTAVAQDDDEQLKGYYLIENFSSALPSIPGFQSVTDSEDKHVGLASTRIDYTFGEGQSQHMIDLGQTRLVTKGTGKLKMWVKGDGSANLLHFDVNSSNTQKPNLGRWTISLKNAEWQEATFDVAGVGGHIKVWLSRVTLQVVGKPEDQKRAGSFHLDDLRLDRDSMAPPVVRLALSGSLMRDYSSDIRFNLDLRNFSREPFRTETSIKMHDHNRNPVAERHYDIDVSQGEVREATLEVKPENLHLYRPPFTLVGEVFSPDNPNVSARVEHKMVMGNSFLLFDDFSNVHGRWFLSGLPFNPGNHGALFAESQHSDARVQTGAAIHRVKIPDAERKQIEEQRKAGQGIAVPDSGSHALKVDFTKSTMVFNGLHRYFPGDAYRMGVWVRGDGSGAAFSAAVMDYTQAGSTSYTWNRSTKWKVPLAKLDFTGWRYIEVPLPGGGLGARSLRGSTTGIDYPLDLSFFMVEAPRPPKDAPPFAKGSVQVGAVYIYTQQRREETISAQVGYDDENHEYAPKHGAWIALQNGWRVDSRLLVAEWNLQDREGDVVARGRQVLDVPAMQSKSVRIELAPHGKAISEHDGPFKLQALVSDQKEAGSATAELVISKPDSMALLADFEADRGYLGLRATGVNPMPSEGDQVTRTTTAQKRGGTRSLEVPWSQGGVRFVSIDPAVPGAPSEVTLWLHGDGSKVLFYPLIGDRAGIISSIEMNQWDLMLPRTKSGPLQNAVVVDWKGWKEITFRLPPIPESWDDVDSVHPFVPSYPVGLHLGTAAPDVAGNGTLFVDDIRVRTHIAPEERVSMVLADMGDSNLKMPGTSIGVEISNADSGGQPRAVEVSGGLFDWRGERVAGLDKKVSLRPGARQKMVIVDKVAPGAYQLSLTLKEGDATLATITRDLLAFNPASVLGGNWQAALENAADLQGPLRDPFAYISHDWDWAEFQPGNFQPDTVLKMAADVRKAKRDPYVVLGYTAFWASGIGYEDMIEDKLPTRAERTPGARWWGGTVDIFHAPERMDDWDNYVRLMMKYVGPHIKAWMLWDSPDNPQVSLGVPAPKFAEMMQVADKWRQRYCPETPILVGGMSRSTAISYLRELGATNALDAIDGANLRIDAGRLSPADAKLQEFIDDMHFTMATSEKPEKRVLVTDLDWAVERAGKGLDAFDQAAYLARATLLLNMQGADHALMLKNTDEGRLGFGLTYRQRVHVPPMHQKLKAHLLKPAWWAEVRLRETLSGLTPAGRIEIQDLYPGRTQGLLFTRKSDSRPVIFVWRNNEPGEISLAATGFAVETAEDVFGSPVKATDGWYGVGKIPVSMVLRPGAEAAALALKRIHTRDPGTEPVWSQRTIASFTPETGTAYKYAQTGGSATNFSGRTSTGQREIAAGLRFAEGATESFTVPVSEKGGLIIRKRYHLDSIGHHAEITVNGQSVGTWNLKASPDLSRGIRRSAFVIPAEAIGEGGSAAIEIKYQSAGSTINWTVLRFDGTALPLSALGPVHADSLVAGMRYARNVVGQELRIGNTRYANGIGVFANHLQEYSLNGQFSKFTADVGIDYATKGKGSVVFRVFADGEEIWDSEVMDGLAIAKKFELDVSGVTRLRLAADDGGDGNSYDAANWANPELHR